MGTNSGSDYFSIQIESYHEQVNIELSCTFFFKILTNEMRILYQFINNNATETSDLQLLI